MQFYRPLSDYVEKYDACLIGGKKNDVSPGRRKSAKKSSELEFYSVHDAIVFYLSCNCFCVT